MWAQRLGAAVVLMQSGDDGEGAAAEAILFRQFGCQSVALIDAHKSAGDARRAEQMSESLRLALKAIGERMPADARTAGFVDRAHAGLPEFVELDGHSTSDRNEHAEGGAGFDDALNACSGHTNTIRIGSAWVSPRSG